MGFASNVFLDHRRQKCKTKIGEPCKQCEANGLTQEPQNLFRLLPSLNCIHRLYCFHARTCRAAHMMNGALLIRGKVWNSQSTPQSLSLHKKGRCCMCCIGMQIALMTLRSFWSTLMAAKSALAGGPYLTWL